MAADPSIVINWESLLSGNTGDTDNDGPVFDVAHREFFFEWFYNRRQPLVHDPVKYI